MSVVRLCHQTLSARQGCLHGDLAFDTFCTGVWQLIDFGLARRYLDHSGVLIPARTDGAFRGSTSYASMHAHQQLDLSRRDDLWSWFYMVVELLDGKWTVPYLLNLILDSCLSIVQRLASAVDKNVRAGIACVKDTIPCTSMGTVL